MVCCYHLYSGYKEVWSVVRRSLQVNIVVVRRSNKWWGRRGRLGGLRCLLQSEVGQLTVADQLFSGKSMY